MIRFPIRLEPTRPGLLAVLPAVLAALLPALAITLLQVAAPEPARAQAAFCNDPGNFCGRTVESGCLTRIGAGAMASAADPEGCDDQLAAYRDCLSLVAAQCGGGEVAITPPPGGGADMMEVWDEIKGSGDPDVFESFARSYPNGPLATLALKRAATLREAASDGGGGGGTQAQPQPQPQHDPAASAAEWRAVEQSWDAGAIDSFLKRYPAAAESGAAKARIAELRVAYREAQEHLNRIGISVGSADGFWGPASTRGLREFEQRKGLPSSGALSQEKLASLRAEPTPSRPAPRPAADRAPPAQPDRAPQANTGRREPDAAVRTGLTAEVRVSVERFGLVVKHCRNRIPVWSKALDLREVEFDCGDPVKLTLVTGNDGEMLRGLVVYNNFDQLRLNGRNWGYVAWKGRRFNRGEIKKISVRVLFLE